MSLLKLRLSIIGTLAIIISISTLAFAIILSFSGIGVTSPAGLTILIFFVLVFNLIQWLFAPYLINAIYKVRVVSESEEPELHRIVDELSKKSHIKKPRVGIANLPIPNAFAYGSPLTGNYVAVTTHLLSDLETEEVEAVIGHEIGHLKHRDVQVMMFISVLPAIFYWIYYTTLWTSAYGRQRGGMAGTIASFCFVVYWILSLFILHLSRLREYFADRHSTSIVKEGPRKLSEALAKIVIGSGRLRRMEMEGIGSFKALLISDPDHAARDIADLSQVMTTDQRLVQEVLSRKVTLVDRILELFSTHPNIVKRLRALQTLH